MNDLTIQNLLAHTRRNRDLVAKALGASEDLRAIDPANVNLPFHIERTARQLEALTAAEAALSKAI